MSKFKVGQAYKVCNGLTTTVVAIMQDGRLLTMVDPARNETAAVRQADGRYVSVDGAHLPEYDLIDPDEPTAEDEQNILDLFKALNYTANNYAGARALLGEERTLKVVKFLREFKASA